ncbi:MAG: hypothetical protein AVDCRST_MAG83-2483, partial [uncultured Arthrobacter sp.]
ETGLRDRRPARAGTACAGMAQRRRERRPADRRDRAAGHLRLRLPVLVPRLPQPRVPSSAEDAGEAEGEGLGRAGEVHRRPDRLRRARHQHRRCGARVGRAIRTHRHRARPRLGLLAHPDGRLPNRWDAVDGHHRTAAGADRRSRRLQRRPGYRRRDDRTTARRVSRHCSRRDRRDRARL